jgi:hypothetical protein
MRLAQVQKLATERGLAVIRSPYKDGTGGYCIEAGTQQIQGPSWCPTLKATAAKLAALGWQDDIWVVRYY